MSLTIELKNKILNAVVPVTCGSSNGTAFFVLPDTLLTARHVVSDCLRNGTPVLLQIGQGVLCKATDMAIPEGGVDVALLKCENYYNTDWLKLLAADFNRDLNLEVFGFPTELGHNHDIVSLKVRNRLEIQNPNYDVVLTREDTLGLTRYNGFSGSPVVNELGSVIGIMTNSISQSLGYISIKKLRTPWLDKFKVIYSKDFYSEDMSILGRGTSKRQVQQAIAEMHSRYNPALHQNDNELEKLIDDFCLRSQQDRYEKKLLEIEQWVSKHSSTKYKIGYYSDLYLQLEILKQRKLTIEESLTLDKYKSSINNLLEVYSRCRKTCLFLKGFAGCGKTHTICYTANRLCSFSNVYLLFGSQFTEKEPIVSQITKLLNFKDKTIEDLNDKMKSDNGNAVIIIDALNEGATDSYWQNSLPVLYAYINKLSNIKFIVSVREPSDNDLSKNLNEEEGFISYKVNGFENATEAIRVYFHHYGIEDKDNVLKTKFYWDFQNPLFLRIFCVVAERCGELYLKNISRFRLYEHYLKIRNEKISSMVDEDEYRNVTTKFLMSVAKYSLYYIHCHDITRIKARQYADRICRYRLWDKNLLNACLKENLLMKVGRDAEHLMFEFQTLGDFLKAKCFIESKAKVESKMDFLLDEFENHPNNQLTQFATALFSEWEDVEYILRNKCERYRRLYRPIVDSLYFNGDNASIIIRWIIANKVFNVRFLVQYINVLNIDVYENFNFYMLSLSIHERDVIWTKSVNELYSEYNGGDFLGFLERENADDIDSKKKSLILLSWMCTSSHPQVRHMILRKIEDIFQQLKSDGLILDVMSMIHTCNDPYVLHVYYAAVYGYVLMNREKTSVCAIAEKVYEYNYSDKDNVPTDIIVRYWTLSILQRAENLDEKFTKFKEATPPYRAAMLETLDGWKTDKEFFGKSHAAYLLYESLTGFSDFNRYILGSNFRGGYSNFLRLKNGKTEPILIDEMVSMMARFIKERCEFDDEIGDLFNDQYSTNRSTNKTERIGKKYQWLALYDIAGRLSDNVEMVNGNRYLSNPTESDIAEHPYPWFFNNHPYLDPTLTDNYQLPRILTPAALNEVQEINNEQWLSDDNIMPEVRLTLKGDNEDWFVLVCYDGLKKTYNGLVRDLFSFTNAAFIPQTMAEPVWRWAAEQDFYGRWMPEDRGQTDFLWNEYPWADRYTWLERHPELTDKDPNGCPCELDLSYVGQLQEYFEGLTNTEQFMSTSYMPNVKVMRSCHLYTAERGVIRSERDNKIVACNFSFDSYNGLAVRKSLLDSYLEENGLALFYYSLGEKYLRDEHYNKSGQMQDLSGCWMYIGGELKEIQPLHVSNKF